MSEEKESSSLSYKNNTKIGEAIVTIKGKGNFCDKVTTTFSIVPKAIKLISAEATANGDLIVKWKKATEPISSYLIQYSTNKRFKDITEVHIPKKQTETTIYKTTYNLKKGKTYYVRICAYKHIKDNNYYSFWSNVLNVKIK